MKKLLAICTALCLSLMGLFSVGAAGADEATYKEAYGEYKSFYTQHYEPSYYAYNDQLKDFAASVSKMELNTMDDYYKVKNFIEQLKKERKDFFGDRVTPGTSRYEVPRMREAMFAAADSGDYGSAINNCLNLTSAVRSRVLFIDSMSSRIENFTNSL